MSQVVLFIIKKKTVWQLNMDFIYDRKCEFKLLAKHKCRLMLCSLYVIHMLTVEKELAKMALTSHTFQTTKSTKNIENQLSWAHSIQNSPTFMPVSLFFL